MKINFCVVLLLAALLAAGCSGDGRKGLSGTVKMNGQPLETGSINFRPAPGTKGNSTGIAITNGEFTIAADKGLPVGNYIVTIQASRNTGRKIRDPQMGMIDEIVPINFMEAGSLKAEITADGDNHFEFNLTARN